MTGELLKYKRELEEVKEIFLEMIMLQMNHKRFARGKDIKEMKSKFLRTPPPILLFIDSCERKWGFNYYQLN